MYEHKLWSGLQVEHTISYKCKHAAMMSKVDKHKPESDDGIRRMATSTIKVVNSMACLAH